MLLPSLLNFSMAGAKALCGKCAVLENTNFTCDQEILLRSRRKAVAARKYQPLDKKGNIFITAPDAVGVSA